MKKKMTALLALLLIFTALSGCSKLGFGGSSQEPGDNAQSSAPGTISTGSQQGGTGDSFERYRIGLVQYQEYAPLDAAREAFMSRLDEWGYDEGKLDIDYQNAGGDLGKAGEICANFVSDKKNLIVAISEPAAKEAAKAVKGSATRMVFVAVSDPQNTLEVKNPQQPEGGVTGIADAPSARAVVDLALQANPELKTFGLLFDPSCQLGSAGLQAFRDYCEEKQITVTEGQLTDPKEAPQRMKELCAQVDAVFTPVDTTVAQAAADTAKAAQDAGKPWYASSEDMVQQGAMACVSIDYSEAGNKAADMAIKLAVGKGVPELPVFGYEEGQVSVNQAVLAALAVELPEEVLATANYY